MPNIWKDTFTEEAFKQIGKIDKKSREQIYRYLDTRILVAENPRFFGKPLTGNWVPFWSFRVGNYRLIVNILDEEKAIYIVRIAHRREVYIQRK